MEREVVMKRVTSSNHPLVKHLVKLRQNRDYRYDHQSLVIEGIKPVEELARHNRFKVIATYNEAMVPLGAEADEILIVNDTVMKKISTMQTPEGVVVEIGMPKPASLSGGKSILALDGVSDPGNVGAMLRSALALGWEGVFILNESCDPFNDKALRAARGATFRIPLSWGSLDQLKKLVKENHLTPLVADIQGKEILQASKKGPILLVMGNEAHGPSKEIKEFCEPVSIAMPGAMESLNVSVAAGILMYVLRRSQ
jgi:RNA methyltransferase, TrmH family